MNKTQKEVAMAIPICQSSYSKIESNKQEPNLFQLFKLSKILLFSIDDYFNIYNNTYQEKRNILNELIKKYN